MQWVLVAFAFGAGILNTVQSGSNTMLRKGLEQPVWSVVVVFAVALATALLAALVSGQRLPQGGGIAAVPWWGWVGGVFGAIYVFSMMLMAERLGAAVFMGLTVTAAVLTSLVMDHFGLLGFEVRGAGLGRVAGGLLMVAGLGLIAWF